MRNLSMSLLGTVIFTLGISGAASATSFLNTSSGEVGTIDSSTGTFSPIGNTPQFFDIGINSQDDLFGVTGGGSLYSIDLNTEMTSVIGNTGAFINGLGFDDTDVLYGTGGNGFYSIDTSSGAASLVSNISGFSSSGDLAYDSVTDQFFAASGNFTGDQLWSIKTDGTASLIGDLGFNNVFGLSFENGTLFGYTANRQQISIDLATGAGTFEGTVSGGNGSIFGAASPLSPTTTVPEPASVLGLIAIGALGVGSKLKRKGN